MTIFRGYWRVVDIRHFGVDKHTRGVDKRPPVVDYHEKYLSRIDFQTK